MAEASSNGVKGETDSMEEITAVINAERANVIRWAGSIKEFRELDPSDKVEFLRSSWNTIVITNIAHCSKQHTDKLLLETGPEVPYGSLLAKKVGVTGIEYESILSDLLPKLREMKLEDFEKYCFLALQMFGRNRNNARGELGYQAFMDQLNKYWRTLSPESRERRFVIFLETLDALLREFEEDFSLCGIHLLFPDSYALNQYLVQQFLPEF